MNRTLLIFGFLFLFFCVNAQTDRDDTRITISANNEKLGRVLKKISTQCHKPISYSHSQVPANRRITVNIHDKPLNEALTEILSPIGLEYVFVENQIIVKPKRQIEPVQPEPPSAKQFTINGYIKEKSTGESVVGATIYTSDLRHGTISNNYGFYAITLPEGEYTMMFSYVGFKRQSENITLNRDYAHNINFELDEQSLEVVIIAEKEDSNVIVTQNKMGYVEMQPRKVAVMPVFLSAPDVIKAMQFMPGVKNTIDGSSNYYIRGGFRDQNLILLDDAPIYNPSHLFGFFSCINPDAVTDIKLYKSDFPPYVGGKLSSVLELKTKEGNLNRFSMAGETGLITTRLSAEGPIVRNRGSFYLSYRITPIEYLFKLSKLYTDFRFDDLNAKLNFRINEKNRLLVSVYSGNDKFFMYSGLNDKTGIQWGNRAGSLRWNHVYGRRVFSNTTLYYSNYDYKLYTSLNNDIYWKTGIKTMGFKNDFTFYQTPENTHYFGIQLNSNTFYPGIYYNNTILSGYLPDIQEMKTGESHLYVTSEKKFSDTWTLRLGLRGTMFSNKGPAKWYVLSDDYVVTDSVNEAGGRYNTLFRIDPSLSVSCKLNDNNALKFNYLKSHQYHQILSNSISPFTSVELWYPSTPNVKPQAADQISVGYFAVFSKNRYEFGLEGFYKKMKNQFDYDNQARFILNTGIEKELRFGSVEAYGFEMILKKNFGKLQGWTGYAFTRAIRNTKDLNSNELYLAHSDRPHDFSTYIQWQPNHFLTLTTGFIYASGMPYTVPTGYYNYMGYKVPVYNKKNNARMPDYYRWDMAIQLMLNKPGRRFEHYFSFSIYNITNKKNPVFINFNKVEDDNGKFIIPGNNGVDNELAPSQIILLGTTPSFKYSFKF
ncbi:MAG: TonB-dependent receptor [Bacteroidales bacterium]|nr:TonB-dependent receptor [Bacteroidales bacterium]